MGDFKVWPSFPVHYRSMSSSMTYCLWVELLLIKVLCLSCQCDCLIDGAITEKNLWIDLVRCFVKWAREHELVILLIGRSWWSVSKEVKKSRMHRINKTHKDDHKWSGLVDCSMGKTWRIERTVTTRWSWSRVRITEVLGGGLISKTQGDNWSRSRDGKVGEHNDKCL